MLGTGPSPQEWSGTRTGSLGSSHSSKSAGVEEVFGQHSQTLGLIFVGPIQLKIFYDSMKSADMMVLQRQKPFY